MEMCIKRIRVKCAAFIISLSIFKATVDMK